MKTRSLFFALALASIAFTVSANMGAISSPTPSSGAEHSAVVPESNWVHVPEAPYVVMVTAQKDTLKAINEAAMYVHNKTVAQCQWSQDKLKSGYYKPYAVMTLQNGEKAVYAQGHIDPKFCPER